MHDNGEEPRGERLGSDAGAPQSVDDPRVVEELLHYRDARARGDLPDRRELLDRYPQFADDLSECLDGLEFVDDAAGELLGDAPRVERSALDRPEAKVLGDFRLIREIGCGGMGVVYEAEQISLRRRVALKVLPFAATLDPRHLQRFENEAHAAASLKHPSIVGVYSVGCDRGVHYYAMEYIDGWTLAEVIQQLRAQRRAPVSDAVPPTVDAAAVVQPSRLHDLAGETSAPQDTGWLALDTKRPTRTPISSDGSTISSEFFFAVAQLGIQAALALEHAHQMGVVHRDIKPSNLLVAGSRELRVQGRESRVQGRESRVQSRESRVEGREPRSSGSRLSTLDPRLSPLHLYITDFGLAMTRQGPELTMTGDVLGTLRYMSPEQIRGTRGVLDHRTDIYSLGVTLYELVTLEFAFAGEDPKRITEQVLGDATPLPSRRNKAIPWDLETILCKAMAFDPQARYESAQAMADDLQAFLEHKPICAQRAPLTSRIRKWFRRNRAASAGLVGCVLALAVIGPIVALEQARLYHAADSARDRAQANLEMAVQAVEGMYVQHAEQFLTDVPESEPAKLNFLNQAIAFYERFTQDNADDARLRGALALAYNRLGLMYYSLQRDADSERTFRQSLEEFSRLVAETPADDSARIRQAWCQAHFGFLLFRRGSMAEAEALFREAKQGASEAVARHPEASEYQWALSHAQDCLGALLLRNGRRGDRRASAGRGHEREAGQCGSRERSLPLLSQLLVSKHGPRAECGRATRTGENVLWPRGSDGGPFGIDLSSRSCVPTSVGVQRQGIRAIPRFDRRG